MSEEIKPLIMDNGDVECDTKCPQCEDGIWCKITGANEEDCMPWYKRHIDALESLLSEQAEVMEKLKAVCEQCKKADAGISN
jgi:hypothetical protein